MVYVTGNDVIGMIPENSCVVWPPDHSEGLVFEIEPNCQLETAINYFWDLFGLIPGITDILLVYALSSFLSPIFRAAGLSSRFPIILEGTTESKKTTLAALTCGAFMRRTNPRRCIVGLTSTRSAVELRAGQMRHCSLIVDDLFPDGGRAQQTKALNLIRDFSNQDTREVKSGKSITGSQMDCGIIITAEFFPQCERSTRTRCLRLKLRERISNGLIRPFQESPARLGNFFKEFLLRVSENYRNLVIKVSQDLGDYRDLRAQDNTFLVQSERLAEIGFMLYETLDIFLSLFREESYEDILYRFQGEINNWLEWQLSQEAVPELRDIVTSIPILHQKFPEYFQDHHGCWCITPDNLCYLLQTYYHDETIDRAFAIKSLQSRGVLKTDKSKAATKKIGGQRYLHLIPHMLWGV